MKQQVLGTFFYMLYLVAMLQPIMPLIEYQVNKDYIASVLCENRDKPQSACNGKCYLTKQLKQSQEERSHDHSLPQIDLSKYPVSLIDCSVVDFEEFSAYNNSQFFYHTRYLERYNDSLLRPPIV